MARWEELVGDSSELLVAPDAQTRKTMAAILRRPGQFGLPPWPKEAPSTPAPGGTLPTRRPSAPSPPSGAGAFISPEPRPVREAEPPPGPASIAKADVPEDDPGTAYQLDMLTGELVPQAGAQPSAATPRVRRPRVRPRRVPANLEQLALWSEEELAS